VIGYFALRTATIARTSPRTASPRRNPPDSVPGVLLARMAVDERHAGRGLGSELLREAILAARTAGEKTGTVFLLVHALDGEARSFYLHHDFELSPSDPLHLILRLKDLPPLPD
jgi:predicted N-acetyltransferase YhbS